MKFDNAKKILTDAAFKLGGELFTHEAFLELSKVKDVDAAKENLNMYVFVETIFDMKSIQDEKLQQFWQLIAAVGILGDYEKSNPD